MRNEKTVFLSVLAAILALSGIVLSGAVTAQEQEGETAPLTGSFRIGYRSVDVGGTVTKFREDYNLDDGPRLFELRLEYAPTDALAGLADQIQIDVDNFGGDPFESFRVALRKHGRYDFSFRRTESLFFYEDTILPVELAGDPGLAQAGDFHTFDFERVRDVADLRLRLSGRAKLNVGFERFTKIGESTTTLDISRDEFELDRPIHESYNEFGVGFEYAWPKVTLILEERVRDFENEVETFLPGFSLGEDPADATTLDFFFLDQPYRYESWEHTARVHARPNDRLMLRVATRLQDLDLDVDATETSQGTDFRGNPFTTDFVGVGQIEREAELVDFDLSYRVSDRVAVIGGLRQHQLDQEGDFFFAGDLGVGRWDIETTGAELGVAVDVSPRVSFAAGVRQEDREVVFAHNEPGEDELEMEEEKTDHTGLFANVAWRPSKRVRLDAEVEDSSYDDPFTLSSPTDRQRYRLRGRVNLEKGFHFTGTYLAYRFENATSSWRLDRDQFNLRAGVRRDRYDVTVGYALVETDRAIDQLVTTLPGFGGGVSFLFPIFYEIDSDFFDLAFRCRVSERVTIGGDLRFYENQGSFPVERDDARGFVEFDVLRDYLVRLGYRTIDYREDVFRFDDYDADILELSIGYRF